MIPVLPLRPGVDKQPEVAAAEVEAEAELDMATLLFRPASIQKV